MKRIIYLILALLFLCLGLVGVLLPVLPTTPFILCSSLFAAQGSKRFHRWLTETRLYQKYGADFIEHRVMTRGTKTKILFFATVMMGCAFYFSNHIAARVVILLILGYKYYYFLYRVETVSQPTLKVETLHD